MTSRQALDLLRAANPVPKQLSYSATDLHSRIEAITTDVQPAVEPMSLLRHTPPRSDLTPSRWMRPRIVATVVVTLAAAAFAVHAVHRGSTASPAAGSDVECAVSTAGGPDATRMRLHSAAGVITTRVESLGGRVSALDIQPGAGTISFVPVGTPVNRATQTCAATTTSIRPVISRRVPTARSGVRSRTPLRGLPFAVPRTEAQYARLTPARQAELTLAVAHVDCGHQAVAQPDQVAVMCDEPDGERAGAFLLGPALAADVDILSATASPPSASRGAITWTVVMSLNRMSSSSVAAFTQAHHSAGTSAASVSDCSVSAVPCSDFLATVVNDTVNSAPLTIATLSGSMQIGGGFTKTGAASFAAEFTAASIGLRLLGIR